VDHLSSVARKRASCGSPKSSLLHLPPQAASPGTPIVAHLRLNTIESNLGRLRPKRPMRMHSNLPHLPDHPLWTAAG